MAQLPHGILTTGGIRKRTAINAHPELAAEIIDKLPIDTITDATSTEPGITHYMFDPKIALPFNDA